MGSLNIFRSIENQPSLRMVRNFARFGRCTLTETPMIIIVVIIILPSNNKIVNFIPSFKNISRRNLGSYHM